MLSQQLSLRKQARKKAGGIELVFAPAMDNQAKSLKLNYLLVC